MNQLNVLIQGKPFSREYAPQFNTEFQRAIEKVLAPYVEKIEAAISNHLNSYNEQLKGRNFAQLSFNQFATPKDMTSNRVVIRCIEVRDEMGEILQKYKTILALEHQVYLQNIFDKELPQLAHNALTVSREVAADYESKAGVSLEDSILSIIEKYYTFIEEIKKLYLEQQSQEIKSILNSNHLYLNAKIEEIRSSGRSGGFKTLEAHR